MAIDNCQDVAEGEWNPSFREQETWIFNTAYYLFGDNSPNVNPKCSWWSRLDEIAKCVGASTGQSMRLIFADAVINIEGADLWHWMRFLAQTAPSEQQMVKLLWPNIAAAWRGDGRTWKLWEAKAVFNDPDEGWGPDSSGEPPLGGQPTPGVFVWRNCWAIMPGDDSPHPGSQVAGYGAVPTLPISIETAGGPLADAEALLHSGVAGNIAHILCRIQGGPAAPISKPDFAMSPYQVVGVLLEYSGAGLRFLATQPLASASISKDGLGALPETCVTMLGGPKGISPGVISVLRSTFEACNVPLLEITVGEQQQMAHVCIGYLRVEDQSGRYKAALTDLFRLGPKRYAEYMAAVAATLPSLCAATFDDQTKRRRVE